MTITPSYPFRRLAVDNLIAGQARVWWEYDPQFNDPGPYIAQLQVGRTGLDVANDWENVGLPAQDAFFLVDDTQRDTGKSLQAHYRIALTTRQGIYVSQPVSCEGALFEKDWITAREILRKEELRANYVSREGLLLKRFRYGTRCPRCLDPLTKEVNDADCPECQGTGFAVGYHPPVPLCCDFSPETITEGQSDNVGTVREDGQVEARVRAFPTIAKYDVWVDRRSDQRWSVERVVHAANIRGVPVVVTLTLKLLPYTHRIYKVEVGGEQPERTPEILPGSGSGAYAIDHDFGEPDGLAYRDAQGGGIEGATVLAFRTSDYLAASPGRPKPNLAVASTATGGNGRWTEALLLDPGDYTLEYFKTGEFGPDLAAITVLATAPQSYSYQSNDANFWNA